MPFQFIESGWRLAPSLILIGAAFWLVQLRATGKAYSYTDDCSSTSPHDAFDDPAGLCR